MAEYRVIEIINEQEIITNYGEVDGARKGNKVKIFEKGEPVKDPFSGEDLGTLDIVKDILTIYETSKFFSVCRKPLKSNIEILAVALTPKSPINSHTEYEALEVKADECSGRERLPKSPIKCGDFVLEIR